MMFSVQSCYRVGLLVVILLSACKSEPTQEPPGPASSAPETSQGNTTSSEVETTTNQENSSEALVLGEELFHDAGRHLPRPAELRDWRYEEAPMYYTSSDLSELIDGGAASFLDFGLVRTAYAVMSLIETPDGVGRQVGLEIYIFEFGTAEGAQSKYDGDHEATSCEVSPPFHISTHCKTSSSIDFLHGPYYLRLNMDYPGLTDHLSGVGELVLARVRAPTAVE